MTKIYSTKKQFRAMFLQSIKSTCALAIAAFLCLCFFSILDSSSYLYMDMTRVTGQFWDSVRNDEISFFANIAFILAGVINAMLLFNFAWSKKQSNVIFSLGIKRSDIYIPKILGGLVPMLSAIILGAIFEIIIAASFGSEINARYMVLVIMYVLQFFLTYALSFLLSSAVMSNCGNIVEGIIFTALLGISTLSLSNFFTHMFWEYTLGANFLEFVLEDVYLDYMLTSPYVEAVDTWSWDNPFFIFSSINQDLLYSYFDAWNTSYPSLYDWSGFISAGIYCVISFILGLIGFTQRKNEIAGTWGRAKRLNEAICILVGFYGIRVLTFFLPVKHGDGAFWTYLVGCADFILLYIIAKLIFSSKRKAAIKASFKRLPVYAAAYGVICLVFSLGLFGYSSNIPEASEIESVTVSSPTYKFMDDYLTGDSFFGLKAQNLNTKNRYNPDLDYSGSSYSYNDYMQEVDFTSESDIAKVLELHKAVIDDGKISNSSSNACATCLRFTYKLKNGDMVTRYYTETTEDTAQKLTSLNETEAVGIKLTDDYFITETEFDLLRSYSEKEELTEEDYLVLDSYNIYLNNKVDYLVNQPCYIFPKDMSQGYSIGLIDKELYKAIVADAVALSSKQYYEHSPADEIGVLSFGLSASDHIESEYYYEDAGFYEDYSDEKTNLDSTGTYAETSWNLNSGDIKTILVTKDMVNTVKYLEEHDMMQYFENTKTADDIKYVKLATPGELYGESKKSYNYPVFYSAYWTAEQMTQWLSDTEYYSYYTNYFEEIDNEITDMDRIEVLLQNATLFGLCSNDSRVMEITYKDGSIATVMVPAGSEGLK